MTSPTPLPTYAGAVIGARSLFRIANRDDAELMCHKLLALGLSKRL